MWTGFIGSCQHSNKFFSSVKCGNFLPNWATSSFSWSTLYTWGYIL